MGVSAKAVIKSVQRGVITITSSNASATATIASVNTAKAEVRHTGMYGASTGTTLSATIGSVEFTNATTLTARRESGTGALNVRYEVTEWY